MNRDPRGLYAALGVGPDATDAEIQRRFRARMRHLHPDVGAQGGEDVRLVLEAFAVLRHPASRGTYDPAYGASPGSGPDDGGDAGGGSRGAGSGAGFRAGRDIPVRLHRTAQPLIRVTPVRWERGPR